MFPGICHTHYPRIAPIVMDTCREFGIPYVVYPTVRVPATYMHRPADVRRVIYLWLATSLQRVVLLLLLLLTC